MSLDSTVKTVASVFIANLFLASTYNSCLALGLGLDNPVVSSPALDSNKVIFVDDHRSPFEVKHVTNVDNDEEDSPESVDDESEETREESSASFPKSDKDEVETSYDEDVEEDSTGLASESDEGSTEPEPTEEEDSVSRGYEGQEPSVPEKVDTQSNQSYANQASDSEPEDLLENPELLAPPTVSKSKSALETKNLKKLVFALQFGSLTDSIKLLELMVRSYPYDPDYRDLLKAAKNLRHADIWYQYQRRLQLPPPSAKPKVIYKLIKMKRNEKPINELKQASWFHLIKGKSRLINSTN